METHFGQSSHLLIEDRLRAMRQEINFRTTTLANFNYYLDDMEYHMFIKQKGLSMIRMLRQVLGEKVLHSAIGHYFEKR
jgi:aminopeptidase N